MAAPTQELLDHVRAALSAEDPAGLQAVLSGAHAADIAKKVNGAAEWDRRISHLRRERNWEGQLAACMDPLKASKLRHDSRPTDEEVCSMCGEFCVFKVADQDRIGLD